MSYRFLKIRLLHISLKTKFSFISLRDQRLKENDQILAINHTPLDQNISHQQAIALLQQTTGCLSLVVAREPAHTKSSTSTSLTDAILPETVSCKFGTIFHFGLWHFKTLRTCHLTCHSLWKMIVSPNAALPY